MSNASSNSVMTLVREHFQKAASSFDSLYEESNPIQRFLRPALFDRLEAAVRVVRDRNSPRVLDVGCGSGRVAERLLDAGAGHYVGVDFSAPMIDLARTRLERFGDKVELITGDFLTAPLQGTFDAVIVVGFWDYIAEPYEFARKMYDLTAPGGVVFGSFPRFTLLKGPVRHVRYEVINSCPIYDYTERELRFLFRGTGFSRVEIDRRGDGYFCWAWRAANP